MANIIYVGNDTLLEVRSLTDQADGSAVESASVSVTMKDASGSNISGQVWPASLAHVSAGTYRVVLPETLDLTAGGEYTAEITASVGGSTAAFWQIPFVARVRDK